MAYESVRMTPAMQWFAALGTGVLVLFAAHLAEEQYRGALDAQTWLVVAPVLFTLLIGVIFVYLNHAWAVGATLAVTLWITVIVGYSHLSPASPDFVGAIYGAYASTASGFAAAAVALALWIVSAVALVEGVWTLTKVEQYPFRRAVAAYP